MICNQLVIYRSGGCIFNDMKKFSIKSHNIYYKCIYYKITIMYITNINFN